MTGSDCSQVWTSYLYTSGAPRYTLAMSVNAGFAVGGILLAAFMRLVLLRAVTCKQTLSACRDAGRGVHER
jgi:hypothetical protein